MFDFSTNRIKLLDSNGKERIIHDGGGECFQMGAVGELKTIEKWSGGVVDIVLNERIEITAKSEQLIKIPVPSQVGRGEFALFEPKAFDEVDVKRGVMWASSYGEVLSDNTMLASVINISNQNVYLDKGLVVGTIERVCHVGANSIVAGDQSKVRVKWDEVTINDKLPDKQRKRVLELLSKYESIFQWGEFDTGLTDVAEHSIDTGNSKPERQKPYRLPHAAQQEVENQINNMLKNNVIEESKSPWCSPIILVKKKSDDPSKKQVYRFCIDFRKLNAVTVKDRYPLPRIDDTVDALGGAVYFSTLDLASGYWQIPLAEEDRDKTAFCANSKLYHFKVMPFGLCNAPSTFQRLMDNILRNLT
jgi:hypothetical protein